MANPIAEILQRYLDDINRAVGKKSKTGEVVGTIALDAKALDISIGTLSQLRNGKMEITDKVIAKIAKKLADGNENREKEIKKELENARSSSLSMPSALDAFDKFFETSPDVQRLICLIYRDMPESTYKGRYPEYINKVASVIRGGLNLALFQPFGSKDEIKKRVIDALDENKFEAADTWNYICQLANGVDEIFRKTKKAVEGGDKTGKKGQIILYEAANVPSLVNCHIHSRLFYSYQISEVNEIRIAQLIKGQEIDREYFIESSTESGFQSAFAAQLYPIVNYWLKTSELPTEESKLESFYRDNEDVYWKIYK